MTETPEAQILAVIRRSGGRLTAPTRTVVAILAERDDHLSVDDLMSEFERRMPGIAPSTIYRVLQRLDQLRLVEQIHSGIGPTFFHLRHQGHAHLVCDRCGSITDIPDTELDGLREAVARDHGFTIEPHHSAVRGVCRSCATKPPD